MDFSVKGILTMLQDLQRIHFGEVSMYVDTLKTDDGVVVACCVFDADGEPHTTSFYPFESDMERRGGYESVIGLVKDICNG